MRAVKSLSRNLRTLPLLFFLSNVAHAALYSTSAGYRYTTGSKNYWGHDFWSYGSARLTGGWYPFGQLAASEDSFYKWVLSPGVGLAKGLPGLGKARLSYTFYRGILHDDSLYGSAHSFELGFSRAFNLNFSGDLAYRLTSGNLFAGTNRQLNALSGQNDSSLRYAVFHQALLGFSLTPTRSSLLFEGGVSAGAGPGSMGFYMESLSASFPLVPRVFASLNAMFTESNRNQARNYLGVGVSYAFAWAARKGS